VVGYIGIWIEVCQEVAGRFNMILVNGNGAQEV
jgi:hypothetical protein